MSYCKDNQIYCEFLNKKEENILNNLDSITFNNDSTIILTIEKSYIQAYFLKNLDLKSISSFNIHKDAYFSKLQYLKLSNQLLAIPKSQILISSLCGLNQRKFMNKIQHYLGSCYKLLLNKNENILFISYFNEIHIFQKYIIGWICIDKLQSLSNRDTIQQISLNFEEDYLVIHTSNSYSGSPALLVYRKKSKDKQIQWDLKQRISQENGEIWGFVNNFQFIFLVYDSLQIYTQNKENQQFENTNSINLRTTNFQFQSYAYLNQHQILLIITKDNISLMQLEEQYKLKFRQQIQINLSKLIEADASTNAFNSILTIDGKYLFIWNRKKTQIIKIMNI